MSLPFVLPLPMVCRPIDVVPSSGSTSDLCAELFGALAFLSVSPPMQL